MNTKKLSADQAKLLVTLATLGGPTPADFLKSPTDDHPVVGECQCGGTLRTTPVSGKPRCDRCRKVGRFKK